MLELRPICENCGVPLEPGSSEAMICSFECTFCRDCVEGLLTNVCPNCGGGFQPRPVRPQRDWRNGNSLTAYPAASERRHRPVNAGVHAVFAAPIRPLPPAER